MKVYMVDDNINKQTNFLKILEVANLRLSSQGSDLILEPGFGNDPRIAQESSVTPSDLCHAIGNREGIFLVDLGLNPHDGSIRDLSDTLVATGQVWASAALANHEAMVQHPDEVVRDTATRFALAIQLLCCCKTAGQPAILVSTDTAGKHVACVKDLELVVPETTGPFPSQKSGVSQSSLEAWAGCILGLVDEIDRLKNSTQHWFRNRYDRSRWNETMGLPHDLEDMPLGDHQAIVRRVLPWAPPDWWSDRSATMALHQNLKFSVGSCAQWMSMEGQNPFPLGGVYLLMLVAVAQRLPEAISQILIPDWKPFYSDGWPLPFFPSQNHIDAQASVRALYEFFCLARIVKGTSRPAFERVTPPSQAERAMRVQLAWTPQQTMALAAAFSESIRAALGNHALDLPPAKSTAALTKVILASNARKDGIGPLGSIMLGENRELRIGRW